MKQLVALLFITLINLSTFSGVPLLWETGYEVLADGEEKDSGTKEDKKELKEFTLHNLKKHYCAPSPASLYGMHQATVFPQPELDKHTPPPDFAC